VLVVGGHTIDSLPSTAVLPCELYRPNHGTWQIVDSLARARLYHTATALLMDGRVVVGGGDGENSIEIYSPTYMFKPRPAITGAPLGAQFGTQINVSYTLPSPTDTIARVALVRPAATTHSVAMNQRYVLLSFHVDAVNGLIVRIPSNPAIAPPGHSMLVIENQDGIPSAGRMIRLE
jgi:hypothetical protein